MIAHSQFVQGVHSMLGEFKYVVPAIALLALAASKRSTTSGTTAAATAGTGTTGAPNTTGTPSPTDPVGPTTITTAANGFAASDTSSSNYIENSAEAIPTDAPGVVVTTNFYTQNEVHLGVDEGPVNWVEVTVTGTLLDGTSFPAPYALRDHDGTGTEYWAINEETDTFLEHAAGATANVTSWRYSQTDKRGGGGPWVTYFADGTKTDPANLPGGTATYNGNFVGESSQGGNGSHAGDWWTYANMQMNMNFGAATWTGNLFNFQHFNKENTNIIVNAGNWNDVPFDITDPPAVVEPAEYPSLPLQAAMQGIINGNDFHGIMRITGQGNPGYVIDRSAVVGSFYGPNGEDAAGSIGYDGTKPDGSNRATLQFRGGFITTR